MKFNFNDYYVRVKHSVFWTKTYNYITAPITNYKNDLAPKESLIFIFCPD